MDKLDHLIEVVEYPQEWLEKALGITGKFEGRGYDNVSSNFDGMGISCGVLQWCAGQGSLQEKILKPYLLKHGSIDRLNLFPSPIMDTFAKSNASTGLKIAINNMNTTTGIFSKKYTIKSDWLSAWRKFLLLDSVIDIQKIACEDVANKSMKLCREWDMISIRSFCWFFDLVTQNGGLKGVTKPRVDGNLLINAINFASSKNKSLWSKRTFTDEQQTLLIASWQRALLSRSAYQKDVMDRKGTIAAGEGIVHGSKFQDIAG